MVLLQYSEQLCDTMFLMIKRWLLLFVFATAGWAQARKVSDAEVNQVHRSALLIDTHNDIPSKTVDGLDIGKRGKETQTDIPRLLEGGVGAQFFAAYVKSSYEKGNHSAHRTLEMIDTIRHDIIGRYPKVFELALTADDNVAAHARGQNAALIGIEGGHAIEENPRLLRDYFSLGVRYTTPAHT